MGEGEFGEMKDGREGFMLRGWGCGYGIEIGLIVNEKYEDIIL